jgi:hypothetical protein
MTEKAKLYWEMFLNRVTSDRPGWTSAKASTRWNWFDLPSGVSGIQFSPSKG